MNLGERIDYMETMIGNMVQRIERLKYANLSADYVRECAAVMRMYSETVTDQCNTIERNAERLMKGESIA